MVSAVSFRSGIPEPLLVVEAGNTTTTVVFFEAESCKGLLHHPTRSLDAEVMRHLVARLVPDSVPALHLVICSVVPAVAALFANAVGGWMPAAASCYMVSAAAPLPFGFQYDPPDAFGADRLALCAWAHVRFPGAAVVAIDAGTAITVDFLNLRHEYGGGFIMPGLSLMARSLHEHTARLPLVQPLPPTSFLGRSTRESISNGIVHGCAAALDGLVERIVGAMQSDGEQGAVKVLLCGGNAALLASLLHCAPHVDELAVVMGSRTLFLHQWEQQRVREATP